MRWGETNTQSPVSGLKRRCGCWVGFKFMYALASRHYGSDEAIIDQNLDDPLGGCHLNDFVSGG